MSSHSLQGSTLGWVVVTPVCEEDSSLHEGEVTCLQLCEKAVEAERGTLVSAASPDLSGCLFKSNGVGASACRPTSHNAGRRHLCSAGSGAVWKPEVCVELCSVLQPRRPAPASGMPGHGAAGSVVTRSCIIQPLSDGTREEAANPSPGAPSALLVRTTHVHPCGAGCWPSAFGSGVL